MLCEHGLDKALWCVERHEPKEQDRLPTSKHALIVRLEEDANRELSAPCQFLSLLCHAVDIISSEEVNPAEAFF